VSPPLLSDAEHTAMDMTGRLARAMKAIIGEEDEIMLADLAEAITHIHALQQMIMSQAAARAYPDRYRLMGRALG
jgi:hypothetical protein